MDGTMEGRKSNYDVMEDARNAFAEFDLWLICTWQAKVEEAERDDDVPLAMKLHDCCLETWYNGYMREGLGQGTWGDFVASSLTSAERETLAMVRKAERCLSCFLSLDDVTKHIMDIETTQICLRELQGKLKQKARMNSNRVEKSNDGMIEECERLQNKAMLRWDFIAGIKRLQADKMLMRHFVWRR